MTSSFKRTIQQKLSASVLFCMVLSIISPFFSIGLINSTYAASPSDVLITEVEYDSIGTENEGEWVELYNPTGSAISLSGWTLGENASGVEYAFTGGASIAAGDFLLLVNDTTVFNSEHVGIVPDIDMEKTDSPNCVSDGECIRLNNTSGDSLTLKDDTGSIIDHMAWEGLDGYTVNGDAGFSVCRRNLTDTDTDAEWSNNCAPTPGTGTFVTKFPGGVPVASLLWSKVDSETYSHGDTMTVLNDRSGNDRNGVNNGTPSFDTTNTINFYPTASFDGIADGFDFPSYSFPIGDKDYTMYAVFTTPLTQDNMTLHYVGRDFSTNNSTITYINSDGSSHDDFDNGVGNLNSSLASSVSANSPTIVSFNYNSATDTKQSFINGEGVATLTGVVDHNASNSASSDRGVGFNADGSSNYFLGNIAEILAYDSELDATSRQKIDSYLALKYGITLDQTSTTNYINSSEVVLWNATINSDYTNNIIGVGQNDLSDLDQKVSHSINSEAIITLSTSDDFTSLNTDGSRTSLVDGKFLIVGSNTGSILTQTGELDSSLYTSRIIREWKVQNTGSVGGVFLKFDGFDENVVLLTDSDGDFSAGATNNGALSSTGTISITLSDGEYFTLATPVSNNPPTDITLSGSTIDENNSILDVIGSLTSADVDVTDTHIYSLVSGTGDTDNGSFSLSGNTLLAGAVYDYETKNSYSIRVETDDQNGGTFEKILTITINDLDEVPPVVTLVGSGTVEILKDVTYTELGASWMDNVDGTGSINPASSGSVDTAIVGNYTLEYTYTDTKSNTGNTVTRTVNVVSGDTPTISFNGSGSITQEIGSTYTDLGAEYSDTEDGTGSVVASGSVDTSTVGVYTLEYNFTDSHGNAATQVTRTVSIVDTTSPVVSLVGSGRVEVLKDATYTELGATWTDNVDGNGAINPASSGSVDTATVGNYTLEYTYTDTNSNTGNAVTRTVNVVAGDTPTITLNGSVSITQEVGLTYTDLGAEYSDTEDGTGSVVASGSVDTSIVGVYTLEYDFTDSHGNAATQVTRTVNIVDTTVPGVIPGTLDETVTDNSATISWQTSEPTSSEIVYGLTTVVDESTGEQDISPRVTSHSVTLSNLEVCTKYFYQTISRDVSGNESIDGIHHFTTTGCAGGADVVEVDTTQIVYTASGATGTGGTQKLSLGAGSQLLEIEVPTGYFDTGTGTCAGTGVYFQLKKIEKNPVIATLGTPVVKVNALRTYDLGAYCSTDEKVKAFDKKLTVTMSYGTADISGIEEPSLVIYRYNTDTSSWESLENCVNDTINNTVTCETDHFSTFGIFGETSTNTGGGSRKKDVCPNGDYTDSKYDRGCGEKPEEEQEVVINTEDEDKGETNTDLIEQIEEEIVQDVEDTQEGSEKIETEKVMTKEVNGNPVIYSLKNDYKTCQTINNLLDVNYTTNFQTHLQDISNLDQKVLIERLEKAGVVSGTVEGNFEGDRDISRVEFLKLVLRSHCIEYREEDASQLDFTDLDNSSWQAKVIKKSVDLGIAVGDLDEAGNKIFRADDVISSIEATKILLRMALVQNGEEPDTQYNDLEVEWHNKYVQQGEYLGVFSAEDDNFIFNPNEGVNRNKTVEFLYKVMRLYR